ncbi:hypothetical protein F4819DRAFT_398619 [Hypoxylon fuscum]|nr:hypothetical protein F4819DRAFT_398619 [Hypoxylon fuscum]
MDRSGFLLFWLFYMIISTPFAIFLGWCILHDPATTRWTPMWAVPALVIMAISGPLCIALYLLSVLSYVSCRGGCYNKDKDKDKDNNKDNDDNDDLENQSHASTHHSSDASSGPGLTPDNSDSDSDSDSDQYIYWRGSELSYGTILTPPSSDDEAA